MNQSLACLRHRRLHRRPRNQRSPESRGRESHNVRRRAPSNPARLFWEVLGRLDLTAFGLECGSVEGKAGRSMLSPRMLLTLWLFAISEGVGSAREIERLTKRDTVYRWIVGDLEVSHHKLSRFRVGHGEALNELAPARSHEERAGVGRLRINKLTIAARRDLVLGWLPRSMSICWRS